MRDADTDTASGLWDADVKAYADTHTLKSLFFSEDWVYIVVDLCALKICAQELRVMRQFIRDGNVVVEPAPMHPLNKIITKPNPFQDYHSWMYWLVVDLTMVGNSICWVPMLSQKIVPLPAENISIDFDQNGDIKNYVSREYYGDGEMYTHGNIAKFNPKEIVHIKRPNPSSLIWGLSPFIPGRKSILFNRYSSEYLNNFYLKGATPGFALEMGEEANEKVAMRLLRSFEMAYTGRRNQRRTLVLPKGVSLKPVTTTIGDQQLAVLVDKNRETIINLLKVPKHELGLQGSGSLGSNEYKTALKNFWASTLIPTQRMIAGALTDFYKNILGENHYLEFDNSNVDVLQEDKDQKATLAANMLKTHTLNEVRSEMYDLPPVEGGDVVVGYNPQIQLPLPNLPLNNEPPLLAEPPIPGKAKFKTGRIKSVMAESSRKIDQQLNDSISGIQKLTLDTFSDMAAAMIKAAKTSIKKAYKADIPSKADLKRKIKKSLEGFDEQWVDGVKQILKTNVERGYDLAVDVPWNAIDKQQIDALRSRNEKKRLDILENRLFDTFDNMNKTTTEDVINTLADMAEENASIDDMAQAIQDKFSEYDKIGYRADRIARTETLTALSIGQAAAMKDAATVVPNLKKIWLTMDDDRVRDSHVAMDGDVVDWDKPFDNGLFFPRDPSGEAGQTINCRCSFVALPAEQMSEYEDEVS